MKAVPETPEEGPKEYSYTGKGVNKPFLYPGEFFFGESDCQINTILGSCIAITLWHPFLRIGGMCHFVLPGRRAPDRVIRTDSTLDGRYLDAAMALFEIEVEMRGTNLEEYHAKIFGGGNMIVDSTQEENELIGSKNIEAAINLLSEKGIPPIVSHVGGAGHRRIVFDVSSGHVWVKHEPLQKIIT